MFQENTSGGGLQIFRRVCLRNINRIRRHINSILLKLADVWRYITRVLSHYAETLTHQLFLFWNCFRIIVEAGVQKCSVKKVFLQIWQNSQENTCARVSFLIKLQPPFHTEHLWRLLLLLVKFLPGRTFRWKNIRGICFSDFGPKLRNQTLRKLLKLALSQKWSQFVKFNFCSNIFVYLAFMAEQLHNKD